MEIEYDIVKLLLPEEKILYVAEQSRIISGTIVTPDKIYVTDRRIIFRDPSMLGLKKNPSQIFYKDIIPGPRGIQLREGIITSDILIRGNMGGILITAISKDDARTIVGIVSDLVLKYEYGYQNVRYIDQNNRFNI